jgi:hypothetical protein
MIVIVVLGAAAIGSTFAVPAVHSDVWEERPDEVNFNTDVMTFISEMGQEDKRPPVTDAFKDLPGTDGASCQHLCSKAQQGECRHTSPRDPEKCKSLYAPAENIGFSPCVINKSGLCRKNVNKEWKCVIKDLKGGALEKEVRRRCAIMKGQPAPGPSPPNGSPPKGSPPKGSPPPPKGKRNQQDAAQTQTQKTCKITQVWKWKGLKREAYVDDMKNVAECAYATMISTAAKITPAFCKITDGRIPKFVDGVVVTSKLMVPTEKISLIATKAMVSQSLAEQASSGNDQPSLEFSLSLDQPSKKVEEVQTSIGKLSSTTAYIQAFKDIRDQTTGVTGVEAPSAEKIASKEATYIDTNAAGNVVAPTLLALILAFITVFLSLK